MSAKKQLNRVRMEYLDIALKWTQEITSKRPDV